MKSYCMLCGDEKNGIRIKEDYVTGSIRWFKRNVTKDEKGNVVVVCEQCYPKYADMRKKFVGRQRNYMILGVAFFILVVIGSPGLVSFCLGALAIAFLFLLSLLSYVPELQVKPEKGKKDGR